MEHSQTRPRRLRSTESLRNLVAETQIGVSDLVAPLFVSEVLDEPAEVSSLPGVFQHTQQSLLNEVAELVELGVPGIILFGLPKHKDAVGSEAWNPDGVVQVALSEISAKFGSEISIMADLCLDEYTDHGHCGIVERDGTVNNDKTIELYAEVALAQARAGAQVIAPSGMMDGQVGAIRKALDSEGFVDLPILAYSAKFASSFYGPFRDAVNVQIAGGGDRKAYQQDWRNANEASLEVELDLLEGADMVMVKPALAYLDVIAKVRAEVNCPVAAYQVSGEYAMIKAAAANGWVDGDALMWETLSAIKRAGASFILSYFAKDVARALSA